MRTADFIYHLPPELIAQIPAATRDASRLLVVHRKERRVEHRHFRDLPEYLTRGDLLVLNNTRVLPARLRAVKPGSGGQIELLLFEEVGPNEWWVMLRPGKRVRAGTALRLLRRDGSESSVAGTVQEKNEEGHCRVRFEWVENIRGALQELGEVPLPPYIERAAGGPTPEDLERYQTVFAQRDGSVAAPTAGLHFTSAVLGELEERGVRRAEVTLHVGLGTFAPVKAERVEEHKMHQETYEVSPAAAAAINETRRLGGRVVAAGTTSLRVLETVAARHGRVQADSGKTQLFVYPPYEFKAVDALLTNFHLPESTLLMLVSAFAAPGQVEGREWMLQVYAEAVRERYRFFSYGDAMLIL